MYWGKGNLLPRRDVIELLISLSTLSVTFCLLFQPVYLSTAIPTGQQPPEGSRGPCQTINRALGNIICNASSCSNPNYLVNVTIRLKDGVHNLAGRASICESRNVTIEAENYGEATVTCESFPNTMPHNFDNLLVCGTSGVTFRGLRFERCGPVASNVFLRNSSDISFEECTFQ